MGIFGVKEEVPLGRPCSVFSAQFLPSKVSVKALSGLLLLARCVGGMRCWGYSWPFLVSVGVRGVGIVESGARFGEKVRSVGHRRSVFP